LRLAPSEAGELFDAVGGFGDGADGRFVQRSLDRFGVIGPFTDGADEVARSLAVEAARAVCRAIAMNGGPSHSRDLAGLQTGESDMHRPEGEQLAAHAQVRMRKSLGRDDGLFGLR
jgi:hypothetical protein